MLCKDNEKAHNMAKELIALIMKEVNDRAGDAEGNRISREYWSS